MGVYALGGMRKVGGPVSPVPTSKAPKIAKHQEKKKTRERGTNYG